jgi:hypothetical protein
MAYKWLHDRRAEKGDNIDVVSISFADSMPTDRPTNQLANPPTHMYRRTLLCTAGIYAAANCHGANVRVGRSVGRSCAQKGADRFLAPTEQTNRRKDWC